MVPAFDGYRALGTIGVVLFHLFQVSGVQVAPGESAWSVVSWGLMPRLPLTLLFIVSGFVIYLPVAARNGRLGSMRVFFVRRAARLLPAYWLSLALAGIVVVAVGNQGDQPNAASVVAHILTLETPALLFSDIHLGFGVIPPVWTLSLEVGFYLLVPIVAVAWSRRPIAALGAAAAVLVVFRELSLHASDVAALVGASMSPAAAQRIADGYGSQLPNWGVAIGAGMTAACLYVRWHGDTSGRVARRAVWGAVGSTALLALFVYLGGRDVSADPALEGALFARQSPVVTVCYPIVVTALMLSIALAPRALQWPVANGPIRWYADISYGVYLIHFAFIFIAVHQLSLPDDGTIWALLAWSGAVIPLSLAYAYASSRWLERPIRRRAHRYSQSVRSDARADALA